MSSREQHADVLDRIRLGVIGEFVPAPGPFGPRPLVYADYTASGRSLDFIERTIAEMVLPFYANTHTETSYTGMQTTRYREQARQTIRSAVGGDARHAVIFTGSGATAAIHRLATVLGLGPQRPDPAQSAVVFVGPYEHHSNDLVWRESWAEVVRIPLDEAGHLDYRILECELRTRAHIGLKFGAFSAASNVTGLRTDLRRLAKLLHGHGARFFADFAAAGPYVAIDIGESQAGAGDHIDAIFLSPHKFIGGPGASGILVADRDLFGNAVPSVPGGGTVSYVTASTRRYVTDIERREEAGTPAILGDIRAGLAFALKSEVGVERIEAIERRLVRRVLSEWSANPAIELLGPRDEERLAIFAFNILAGGKYLHPNFVVAVLNDLFGLQVRGGCSCAGPYAHDLLDISDNMAERYETLVAAGYSVFRPGWVRFSLNYFLHSKVVDYILAAVEFVARRGTDLLRLYRCDPKSGRWLCAAPETRAVPIGFDDLIVTFRGSGPAPMPPLKPDFPAYLAAAEAIADAALERPAARSPRQLPDVPWFATTEDLEAAGALA